MASSATDRPDVDLPEKDSYAYDDYQQLPEGAPYELISGHLVMSPSPTPTHQRVLQPDLIYVAQNHLDIVGEQEIKEAPDLIAEILFPSTAHKDLTTKKRLYEVHGVAEYWTIDPDQQAVEIFQNTDDGFVQSARVVEQGTVSSALLDDFSLDLEELF